MKELELTFERVFKVWWSLFWRGLLLTGLGGFAVGFIIGFVCNLVGIGHGTATTLSFIAGFLLGIAIGIWLIKYVLGKKFSDFRIALVRYQPRRIAGQRILNHTQSPWGRAKTKKRKDFSIKKIEEKINNALST